MTIPPHVKYLPAGDKKTCKPASIILHSKRGKKQICPDRKGKAVCGTGLHDEKQKIAFPERIDVIREGTGNRLIPTMNMQG